MQIQHTDSAVELIIINDDVSSPELLSLCRQFIHKPPFVDIRVFSTGRTYRYRNQNFALNCAIQRASSDLLIIQNPECLHVGNVVDGLHAQLVAAQNPFYCSKTLALMPDDNTWLSQHESEWLQHPDILTNMFAGREEYVGRKNPRLFFFCLGTTAAAMRKIGGFDEDIKEIAYDDDLFAFHAKVNGLDCRILDPADFCVLHQNHQRDNQSDAGGSLAAQKSCAIYHQIVDATLKGTRPSVANPGRAWGQIEDSLEDKIL